VFESRRPTGQVWQSSAARPDEPSFPTGAAPEVGAGDAPAPSSGDADLILSRILTLAGQEEGVNRGHGCDSQARYIYIHGTNHEDRIGQPVSHGCVRLTNTDVIDLFAKVEEGDPVVIV
jgi:UDP-N-acetylmuramate--alanine ligase